MTDAEASRDLKVTVRLLFDGKEIQTVEKPFAVQKDVENAEDTKSIDETVTEFLDSIQKTAAESGYSIEKKLAVQTLLALIFYLIKQDSDEKTIEIQLTKQETKENGDNANSS